MCRVLQCIFLSLAFAAFAAAADQTTRARAEARVSASSPEWTDLVRRYAEKPDGVADFEERRYFPFRREPVVLKGQVRVSRVHGLSLHYTAPEERTLILDETGMLVREPKGQKSPPLDPRATAANEVMRHILRLDFAALEKSFEISGVRGPDEWSLTLVPRADTMRRALGDIHVGGDAISVRQIDLRKSAKQHVDITMSPAREVGAFTADEVKRYFR
ncbi:MAG TPA: outer membrane lipoprotein carrier protein LolA [Opitutaceae bacterium]|nr:outer membrane lipoprotein carrier protein LolA [Opitutaceae bacterium]